MKPTVVSAYRVQVMGRREVAYFTNATPEDCARRIARILTLEPPALVLTDGQTAPEALVSFCERAQIPLFATAEPSAFVIDLLRAYLSKHFAERTTMHGVFASTTPPSKAAAPTCCATCWRCAASACWTSAPSLARRRYAARCGCN